MYENVFLKFDDISAIKIVINQSTLIICGSRVLLSLTLTFVEVIVNDGEIILRFSNI